MYKNKLWAIITIAVIVILIGVGADYYFGNTSSMQNRNNSSNPNSQNNTQTNPLLKVASNTAVRSYYGVTNIEKNRTDIVLIIQSPDIYSAWINQKARLFFYLPGSHNMAGGFYYGLEEIETLGNNEYKITIPLPIYTNLNGESYDMTLGYGWTGVVNYFRPYNDTYPITILHFYVKLSVVNYLIGQLNHGNNDYSIQDFEYIIIHNSGNCPFYYYMKNLHGIDLVVQGKTFDMQYTEGPWYIKYNGDSKFKFIVDITGETYLQGGNWPAKIILKENYNTSKSVSVNFTINIGN